jgi:hypothetical protein
MRSAQRAKTSPSDRVFVEAAARQFTNECNQSERHVRRLPNRIDGLQKHPLISDFEAFQIQSGGFTKPPKNSEIIRG